MTSQAIEDRYADIQLLSGCDYCGRRLTDGAEQMINRPHQIYTPSGHYQGVLCGRCFLEHLTPNKPEPPRHE